MEEKVVLVLVDGMRPDGIDRCGNDTLKELAAAGASCWQGRSVMPSVTLPCHSSLFFSVPPERHGITTNTWMPLVRPVPSLGDAVRGAEKKAAMVYNWEQLRDLNRPGSLAFSYYRAKAIGHENALRSEQELTETALRYWDEEKPDFLFLYLGYADDAGHKFGWMEPEYLEAVANASACIGRVREALPESVHLLVTADHGGHERGHGCDMPEDMVIPFIFHGPRFAAGTVYENVSLLDVAPTVAGLLGVRCPSEWEGRDLLG